MTERVMTDRLAERVLGWRRAPGRFLTGDRTWIPHSRFRPFQDIRAALRLADKLTRSYALTAGPGGFTAVVSYRGRTTSATARHKARAMTLAIADTVGLWPQSEALVATSRAVVRGGK